MEGRGGGVRGGDGGGVGVRDGHEKMWREASEPGRGAHGLTAVT